MAKKITGSISLTLTAVVNEVTQTPQGHMKHSLGYVCVADDDGKKYQNWQYLSYAKPDTEAKVYQPGTVLRLTFKSFSIFTAQNGGVYLSPEGFVHVDVVKFGDKEQGEQGDQPTTYNSPSKKTPPTPVAEEDDTF